MENIYLIFYYFIYLAAVFTVGWFFLKLLKTDFGNKIEEKVYQFAVGNLIYSYAFHYLGMLHLLYGQLLLVLYLLPAFFIVIKILRGDLKLNLVINTKKFLKHRWETSEIIIFFFLLSIFVPLIPHIFAFPTSWDALAYHLMLPKIDLRDHYFAFYEWFPQTVMPLGIESLFGFGEVLKEPRLANFIVFTFVVFLTVYILYGLRYMFTRKVLFIALILFLFRKILFSEVAVTPYVDFPLAFYSLLIATTLVKYLKTHKWRFLLLVFIFSLFSFLIKYGLGLLLIFSVLVVLSVYTLPHFSTIKKLTLGTKKSHRLLFIFVLVVFMAPIFYWFLRNFVYTQNPVYPLFNNIIGGLNYDETSFKAQMATMRNGSLTFDIFRSFLLRLPVNYLLLEEVLFSATVIIFSIFGIFYKGKIIKYIALLGLLLAALIYWVVGFPSYRYALASAPILAIVASYMFFEIFKKSFVWYKLPLLGIFIISFFIQLSSTYRYNYKFFLYNFRASLRSLGSYDGALKNLYLQDNYYSINYINKNLDKKKDKVLMVFDNRLYYIDIPVEYDNPSINGFFTNPRLKNPKEVSDLLKERGFNYIFVNNNWGICDNLREDIYYPFVLNYLEPVASSSGTVVYKLK